MNHNDDAAFLKAAEKRKIAFCKKYGLPIPAFDKVEDFFIDYRVPCPVCGSKDGYAATGTFTHFYEADGTPMGYELGSEGMSVKCVKCNANFQREKLFIRNREHKEGQARGTWNDKDGPGCGEGVCGDSCDSFPQGRAASAPCQCEEGG